MYPPPLWMIKIFGVLLGRGFRPNHVCGDSMKNVVLAAVVSSRGSRSSCVARYEKPRPEKPNYVHYIRRLQILPQTFFINQFSKLFCSDLRQKTWFWQQLSRKV
jgi:hypothetical protein